MARFSPGPYRLHQHNPVLVLDANDRGIGQSLPVGSRKEREANARLFAASWGNHHDGYELAIRVVDASLYSSDPDVAALVNRLVARHKQTEQGQ